jgi:mannan endo-1,4-beta-mannosidase
MRFGTITATLILILLSASGTGDSQVISASQPSPNAAPVNRNATPEARALLREIDAVSGQHTFTGQHNFPNEQSRWSDRIYDLTGKFPAVFGQDFGFSSGQDKDSIEGRPVMIEEVKRQYRNGSIIALTWHAVRPTDEEPVTFRDSVQGHLTDFEWNELLTPGTDIYNRWVEQVDIVAGYLRQLQEAGVPVLFRPYHEINGNWFWWGGRPAEKGSAALYRQIYDRFVNHHHLNNLVWVWNVNSPSVNAGSLSDYFPGKQYADVVTMDNYGEFKQSYYDDILALAGDKPIALAEVGAMPSLEVLAQQPRWAYFMMWSGLSEASNPAEKMQSIFHAPNLLNRGDPPLSSVSDAVSATAASRSVEPVSPDALPEAKAILARLYAAQGTHTLSGQQNDAGSLTKATEQVFQATAKYPAIYGAELDTTAGAKISVQAVLDEAVRQSRQKAIISLTWIAPNPAEADTVDPEKSKRALTDYEWRELRRPGSGLNQRWCAQVDALAVALKRLDDQGIAVLWIPYPESNGKRYWWAGRSGMHGSASLYRMLFDRLVNQHHLRNLLWAWEAAPPGFGPTANGSYTDYFPGLLYVDALMLQSAGRAGARFRSDAALRAFGAGKVLGLSWTGPTPDPEFFERETNWAWFLLGSQEAPQADASSSAAAISAKALQSLYADPRVISR